MRNKLYIAIGIPGSGKSQFKIDDVKVVQSDSIRKSLDDGITSNKSPSVVFGIAHGMIDFYLEMGHNVYFDATNVKIGDRRKLINRFKNRCELIGVVFDTPVETCKLRNSKRRRKVPEYVIDRMYSQFKCNPPSLWEGFDRLLYVDNQGKSQYIYKEAHWEEIKDFSKIRNNLPQIYKSVKELDDYVEAVTRGIIKELRGDDL